MRDDGSNMRYRHDRDDRNPYSMQPSHSGSSHANDGRGDRDGYNSRALPMHSGPPSDQSRSSYGWSDRSSSSRPPNGYSQSIPPPPHSNGHQYSYPPSASSSTYDRYEREAGSSLPPPPPSYHHSPSGYPPAYSPSSQRAPPAYPPARSSSNGYHTPSAYDHQSSDQRSPYADHSPSTGYSSESHGVPMYESMEERPARRRRGNLPKWATDYLKQWFFEHVAHPYPTEQEKQELCKITGLGMTQLSNWFINARRRQNPVLQAQAQAETMIRENSGPARSSSDSTGRTHRSNDGE